MIRKIILFFVLLLISGCTDIRYDGSTRLVLEGRIINREGQPLGNRYIDIAVYNGEKYGSNAQDIISAGQTDANGQFQLVIPAPQGINNNVSIRINPNATDYQYKEFALIQRKDFMDYRYSLNDVVLHLQNSISNLVVTTQQDNPMREISLVRIEGEQAEETVFVNSHPINFIYDVYSFSVIKNQTVMLHYSVTDYTTPNNSQTTDYSVAVAITNAAQTNYTINY